MTKGDSDIIKEKIPMPVEKFLTIKEIAKRLRVSERSVMRYIKAKKLRASKMGQWRIKNRDRERFFNTNANHKGGRKL